MKTITIIDIFGFFFRSYFALPPLRNSQGFPTGLLTGFINLIDSLRREHNTDYIVFALDTKGKSFREDIYPEYKANRGEAPEDLLKQLPIAVEWIDRMGFANISKDGYEADDIIATITSFAKSRGLRVRVVSHDKDLYQLIDDNRVTLYDAVKKVEVDEDGCFKKFGVKPQDFTNFQALVGDSSDNIPGVKGIGKIGASKLINRFHTLENIYENIDRVGTKRVQKLLLDGKESAFLSRELVTLRQDIFEDFELDSFIFKDRNYLIPLIDDFKIYEMKQALEKANFKGTPQISFKHITLNSSKRLFKIIETITTDTIVAFDIETTGLNIREDKLVGFSFAMDNYRAYYVPIAHNYLGVGEQVNIDDGIRAIKKILKAKVVGQNLKFDLSLLYYRYGIERIVPYADTMIMAWLLNPGSKIGLDTLSKKFFNYEMKSFKSLVKKGEDFSSVDIDLASFYAAEDALITYRLYFKLNGLLDKSLRDEAKRVEYPFIDVLIDMEQIGIKIDIDRLNSLKNLLSNRIKELTEEIYMLSGTEFNIKSTQQLGEILFNRLGLKGAKRTKTGYSTNEKVLNQLIDEHEIIHRILEYRATQKLLSTYAIPLLKLAKQDKNSRIYTSFLQTGTSTGRLSSKEPNLQNIPVRSPLGRKIREAFIAKDGYKLLSIDYSQIELRLLAHFSKDKTLIEAFQSDMDIHTTTAIKLFGEELAKEKRAIAKSINFGILYGMGPKKLSGELKISIGEAREIISNYFNSFPTVKRFLESVQDRVQEIGYIETLLERKRFFDYKSANSMQKASFMRESINTLFQGSASDLIKLSMLEIDSKIKRDNIDGAMLLQIHDELIFEIREDIIDEVAEEFKEIMENIMELNVPLKCSVNIGDSWGELK